MPTINVNGQPPEGGRRGPRTAQEFTDAWEAAKAAQARANGQSADYGKAEAQRDADALRRQRQEDAAWKAYDRQQETDRKKLESLSRDQIRQREQDLREEKQAAARARRQKDADERAEIRLERQKQVESNRRVNQEEALRRNFGNMANRANWHLSAPGFRGLGQQARNFDDRVFAFRNRWGQAPNYGGNINELRQGMGTLEGTYHTSNILRMGSAGQRFAFEGNYAELVRIERELQRIEKLTERQARFATSPSAQANLERQKNALLHARSQIAAGTEGRSPLYNAVGRGYGKIMNTFRDPVMRTIMDAAMVTVGAPYVGNRMLSGVIGMQTPYLNWDLAAHQIARGGLFKPLGMQESLLNMDKSGFVPGNGLGPMAQEFGLNPKDVFNQVLNQYGVPVRDSQEAARIAASVRMGYLAPGVQLPEEQLFRGLGSLTSVGVVKGNQGSLGGDQASRDAYFRQLQKTMALATQEGVNQSAMAQGWTNLVRSAAVQGLGTNMDQFSNWFRAMAASGAPGAREGELQSNIFAGTQQAIQGIGVTGNTGMNIAVMSAFRGRLPKTEEDLTKQLGITIDHKNPAQEQAVKNYLAAAKSNSPFALEMLQPLLSGQSPDVLQKLLLKSPLIQSLPPGAREVAMSNLMGSNVTAYTAMQAAQSGATDKAMSGVAPYVPQDLKQFIDAKASQNGMSNSALQALIMTESGGNPKAVSKAGAIGMTQVMPGTIAEYNKAKGTNWTPQDALRNASINTDIGEWYYQKMLEEAGGDQVLAYGMYNAGPGRKKDILEGRAPKETKEAMGIFARNLQQYDSSSQAMADYQRLATGGAADLQGSRYVTEISDKVVAAFTTAAGAVEGLATAAEHAARWLGTFGNDSQPVSPRNPRMSYPSTDQQLPYGGNFVRK